jgi:P-type E1-E2 ATPase
LLIPNIFQYIDNRELKKYVFNSGYVKVWRDGVKKEIECCELVVGDVVEIKKGSVVGADGLVIEGNMEVKEILGKRELVISKKNTKQCIKEWADSQ